MQLYCGTPAIQGKITLLYNVTLLWDFCSARQDYTTVQYDFSVGLLYYSMTLLWDFCSTGQDYATVQYDVSRCFEPSQPLGVTSGLSTV